MALQTQRANRGGSIALTKTQSLKASSLSTPTLEYMASVFPEPPPGSIHAEYILSDQLRFAEIPADVILKQVRPQNPQVFLPPRLGYNDHQLTIGDVLDVSRWVPQRRSFVSGAAAIPRTAPTKPTPGDRTVWTEDVWSGTSRNSLGTV